MKNRSFRFDQLEYSVCIGYKYGHTHRRVVDQILTSSTFEELQVNPDWTFYELMNSSFWFDTMNMGLSIVYNKG